MKVVRLAEVDLSSTWSEADPSIRSRVAYPVYWATGAASSALVVFELDPGHRLGQHVHSAEELVVVIRGTVEVEIEGERLKVSPPVAAIAPAMAPHDVHNVGEEVAFCVGFFSAAAVTTLYDDKMEPSGSRASGTPQPDNV
jgi:quercetin dioxygenase-like cupin family protein